MPLKENVCLVIYWTPYVGFNTGSLSRYSRIQFSSEFDPNWWIFFGQNLTQEVYRVQLGLNWSHAQISRLLLSMWLPLAAMYNTRKSNVQDKSCYKTCLETWEEIFKVCFSFTWAIIFDVGGKELECRITGIKLIDQAVMLRATMILVSNQGPHNLLSQFKKVKILQKEIDVVCVLRDLALSCRVVGYSRSLKLIQDRDTDVRTLATM